MGEPQRILNIARRMIKLSGRTIKDEVTGEGDIAIEIIGLRPGEKLHEELLIDRTSTKPTSHEKILWAEESKLSEFEMVVAWKEIDSAIKTADCQALRRALAARVDGYCEQ